jgi:phage terminase small subunit
VTQKKRGRKPGTKLQKPLTAQELVFCKNYCDHGNQVEAFRDVWPDHKSPHGAASRLMKRPEIKDQITRILEKNRDRAAEDAARSLGLTLAAADSRLAELIQTRRRTRGEMFTRDTGELQDGGVSIKLQPPPSGKGKPVVTIEKSEGFEASLSESAPIEDSDLIKAIDLTYKRKAGFPLKPSESKPPAPTNVFLYQPAWKLQRQQQALPPESEVVEAETA